MSKPLEIHNGENWILFNWFSHIEYKAKESALECSISPKLKPYLLELKGNFKPLVVDGIKKVIDGITTLDELDKKIILY